MCACGRQRVLPSTGKCFDCSGLKHEDPKPQSNTAIESLERAVMDSFTRTKVVKEDLCAAVANRRRAANELFQDAHIPIDPELPSLAITNVQRRVLYATALEAFRADNLLVAFDMVEQFKNGKPCCVQCDVFIWGGALAKRCTCDCHKLTQEERTELDFYIAEKTTEHLDRIAQERAQEEKE